MPKTTCTCNDDSTKEYANEAPTFQTYYHFDNTFVPTFQNPSRMLKDLVKNGAPVTLVDRANCNSCDDSISTQEKLKVRKKDRPTPYRVPYNHFRKVTSCITGCDTNVKIIKDLSCNDTDCVPVNYSISRLVDKNGVRNLNNGGNYKNYLQLTGKTYYQNTAGILPENAVSDKINTYKIGSVEKTVNNYNSGTSVDDCQLGYGVTTSLFDKSFTILSFNTTTKKYSNPSHKTSGSVSSKQHIHKKKFRNILAGQSVGKKDGYNNCRNGEFCTLYMKPGPNTKLFMGKTPIQRCIPPRIRGIKQTCPVPPPTCEANKFINPRFERTEYTTTFNGGTLTITIDHCPLKENDEISISFLGYSTTVESIFTPTTDTDATSAITSSETVSAGEIITLTITQLTVNANNITWIMPVDVGEGTTTIVLNDGGNDTIVNSTNGPSGVIYANVNIPRHFSVNSSQAWIITPIDPCYYRQLNGTGAITAELPINSTTYIYPSGTFVSASVPNGTTHNPEDILMRFTLSIENFVQGDVLSIDFYTSSSFGTGFFNTTSYPTGISNWNLANAFGSYSTIPTILLVNFNSVSETETPMANAFSSASWSGTTLVNLSGSIYYKQTLSITIGSGAPSTSSTNESYYLYLFRGRETVEGETTYTKLFSNHPTSAGEVKFSISCTCFTGTGITDGYNFGGPCSGVASNAAFTINNATEGMSLANYDDVANLITPITTYIPGLDPPIVKFTFSLSYAGNQGLTKGDVIVFRITTDYGDQYSGFFTSYGAGNNMTWQLNKRPQAGDDNYGMIWLEQGGSVLDGNGYGIESINFANYTYNTNTNVYSHFLYVTIGKNITNISNAQGSLTLGIYANNDIITSFPDGAYNISYEIDSYCWTSTGNQSDISYDPCNGRSGSLTGGSITKYPNNMDGGEDLEYIFLPFTPTSDGITNTSSKIVPGDTIIVKIYTTPTTFSFFDTTWISNNPFGVSVNSGSYPGIYIEDPNGQNSGTPLANAITDFTVTDNGVINGKRVNTLSIQLSSPLGQTEWIAEDDSSKIIMQNGINTASWINQFPNANGTLNYEIDVNCLTSTGSGNGFTFSQVDPCGGRSGSLTNSSLTVTGFGESPGIITGGDYIELAEVAFTATDSALIGGDILILKLIVDYQSTASIGFWTEDLFSYGGVAFNSSATSPSCWFTQGTNTTPVSGMIQSITLTSTTSGNPVNKWIQVMSITLAGTSTTTYGSAGTNWKFNMQGKDNDSTMNITQTSSTTAGSIDYELDLNCFTGTGEQLGASWPVPGSLSNLSLIPSNFGGYNSSGTNGLGSNNGQKLEPVQTLRRYSEGDLDSEKDKMYVALKFTHSSPLYSGYKIKLIVEKPVGTNTPSFAEAIFYTGGNPWTQPSNPPDPNRTPSATTDGVSLPITSIVIGTYDAIDDKQEVTITLGGNSNANSVIEIKYFDYGNNVWANNTEEGKEMKFDLDLTGHNISSNNSGWYVQDISGAQLGPVSYPSPPYPSGSGDNRVIKSINATTPGFAFGNYPGENDVSKIIYRHYSAIPSGSYIFIYFRTTNGPFFTNTNWSNQITNNPFYTGGVNTYQTEFGIRILEKDLNDGTTSNVIGLQPISGGSSPGSVRYGDVIDHTYVATGTQPANSYYTQYLRIQTNDNITGGTGKYIEIYMNDIGQNQEEPGGNNWTGYLKVSIEVRSSTSITDNSNLLGSVYLDGFGEEQT